MRSYIEILTELKNTVNADNIPHKDEVIIHQMINDLMNVLWDYSD